jgi:hypothetical protein
MNQGKEEAAIQVQWLQGSIPEFCQAATLLGMSILIDKFCLCAQNQTDESVTLNLHPCGASMTYRNNLAAAAAYRHLGQI